MISEAALTLSLLLDMLRDPYAFAFLVTVSVLAVGYYDRRYGLAFFVSIAATFALIHIAKSVFGVPRPDGALIEATGYRFPSLHAAIGGAVLASLWWYAWRRFDSTILRFGITVAAFSSIVFIAWSRILLGVHVPVDVVVGSTIGVTTALLVHFLSERLSTTS